MLLALDLGSKNMKVSGMIDDEICHALIKSLVTSNGIDENRVVELNGRKTYFGIGNPLVKRDKTERDYILESIMFATYEIYGHLMKDFDIELGIGLPLNQYKSSAKNDYENKLNELYLDKKFKGKVNGYDVSLKIKFIKIYAEGYSSLASIYNSLNKEIPFIIVDMGYKTTDVIGVKVDNEELVIDGYGSINKGMLEVLNNIKNGFYNDNKIEYPVETIESSIINNIPLKIGSDKVKPQLHYGNEVISEIYNRIETEIFPDMRARNIYQIGGGASLAKHILNSFDIITLQNEEQSMFANADGYLFQLIRDTL